MAEGRATRFKKRATSTSTAGHDHDGCPERCTGPRRPRPLFTDSLVSPRSEPNVGDPPATSGMLTILCCSSSPAPCLLSAYTRLALGLSIFRVAALDVLDRGRGLAEQGRARTNQTTATNVSPISPSTQRAPISPGGAMLRPSPFGRVWP